MHLSILVAKILALYYISAAIAILSGKLSYAQLVDDLQKSPALIFVTGFITIILGTILVHYHNIWVANWPVLITVVGWLSLLKGILLIACPQFTVSFKNYYKNSKVWGFVMLACGILFGYFGFIN